LSLAVVVTSWLRDPSEQRFADRMELLFGQQAGFEGSFDIALLAGRVHYLQISGDIVDHPLNRIERNTAHNALIDLQSG